MIFTVEGEGDLGFDTTSEGGLSLVIGIGIVVLILSLLLVLQTLLLRALLIVRQRRSESFLKVWRPLLMQSLEAVPTSLPRILPGDVYTFLSVWNYLHESLLAATKENLNHLARQTEMDVTARQMLRHRSLRQQLMAVVTLGHLRDASAWEHLQQLALSHHTVLSLAAARSLLQINPHDAIRWLLPLIAKRHDWPATRVVRFLQETGADIVSNPLAYMLITTEPEYQARLVRFLDVAHSEVVLDVIRFLLQNSKDEQVLQHCLQFITDPEDAMYARNCLTHPEWFVRVQAAVALGRVGLNEDQVRLIPLLEDPQWWVRYRTAQSLVNWPSIVFTKLERLAAMHPNPFAREILTQTMAERRMKGEAQR